MDDNTNKHALGIWVVTAAKWILALVLILEKWQVFSYIGKRSRLSKMLSRQQQTSKKK
jgi:hypothetical protein